MKRNYPLLLAVVVFGMNAALAQLPDKDLNYLLVREDVVKPSRAALYEASLFDLAQFLTENKVKEVNYMTQIQDNFHYAHVARLASMEDINGGLEAFIRGEEKSAEFNLIWEALNKTIESYRYYVVKYEPALSYVPDGQIWLEEAPYRRWNYLHFEPGTEKEAERILMAWKNLYEDRGAQSGFRVFKGVIGLDQPTMLLTTWSASPYEYQRELDESIALLDEEGTVLWLAMMELVRKAETIEGWYLSQYSFLPETGKK